MKTMTAQNSLAEAVNLGLISSDQVEPMLAQYNETQILEILENLISTQMHSGIQCSGNECSI